MTAIKSVRIFNLVMRQISYQHLHKFMVNDGFGKIIRKTFSHIPFLCPDDRIGCKAYHRCLTVQAILLLPYDL